MPLKSLKFEGASVALIVRGKHSPSHIPDKTAQHADCILPKGTPVGFFGVGGGKSGTGGSKGIGMKGMVFYYDDFVINRPPYVDREVAKASNNVCTVLKLDVTREQALKFYTAWGEMRANAGKFNLLGNNCATHAALAFYNSGLLAVPEIPGLDTPNNLYLTLRAAYGGESLSGFLGFKKKAQGGGFDVEIEMR